MAARGKSRRTADRVDDRPSFALERFEWGAPDRLEVAGTFSGIADAPGGDPVLTVHGPDGPRRLPAAGDGAGPPADGARWTAAFAWLEPPVAFDAARLELGPALAVELPGPGDAEEGRSLPVEPLQDRNGDESAPGADMDIDAEADGAASRLRLEAQMLDAQQQLEEARVVAQRAQEELERTQTDLMAAREREAADAVRYREGLAGVRASAEVALDAAALARTHAEQEAQAEIDALRERVADLEPAGAELEATRAELAEARSALADARAGAQILFDGLARYADSPTDGR